MDERGGAFACFSEPDRAPLLVCFSHLRWNFVWQRPQHLLTRAARNHRVVFIEEPVFPDDLDGYELIRRSQPIPLAGGESEFGIFGFRELLARRALDIVQPDVARIGGYTAAKRLGALVHAHNVKYAPHTGFSCGLAQVASAHLAASVPNLWRLENMWIGNPLAEIFEQPLPQPVNGMLTLPTGPGLGLDPDRAKLDRFRAR